MEIIANTTDFYLNRDTAVALGKFDGIHIGHRRLLDEILQQKEKGLTACVFTFDPFPEVLFGKCDNKELTVKEEKRVLLERMGVDILIEFPLTLHSAAMPPEDFITEVLAKRMNTRFIAAGSDLSFGAKGAGNAALLESFKESCDFQVKIIPKICLDGKEVSSTYIRTQIEKGNMPFAEQLLGMPYFIIGKASKGDYIGKSLGIPTINTFLSKEKLLPPNGVYYSRVFYRNQYYKSISYIGCRPDTEKSKENNIIIESYLYHFSQEIYEQEIEVSLYEWKRQEQKFVEIELLREQFKKDIQDRAIYIR